MMHSYSCLALFVPAEPVNMPLMSVTAVVLHPPTSWLKAVMSSNMPLMSVTPAVFHPDPPIGWLSAEAPLNMPLMFVTPAVFHPPISLLCIVLLCFALVCFALLRIAFYLACRFHAFNCLTMSSYTIQGLLHRPTQSQPRQGFTVSSTSGLNSPTHLRDSQTQGNRGLWPCTVRDIWAEAEHLSLGGIVACGRVRDC